MIAVFLLFGSNGLQAQNVTPKLDQLKLAEVFVGTWKQNVSKDTIEVSETQQYGKAFVNNVYLVIDGKKAFSYIEDYGFSTKEGKFKGFILYRSGGYATWIASFTSERKFSGDFVQNFNPETVTAKFEIILEPPTNMTIIVFDTNSVKTGEYKYFKVK